jgi:hypothetical protein
MMRLLARVTRRIINERTCAAKHEDAEKLGNPRPPIVVIPHGVTIQSLSAEDLATIGLSRL